MHSKLISRPVLWLAPIIFGLVVAPGVSFGNVDLVLVATNDCVQVGDIVEIELYAVSDSAVDQPFSTVEAIIRWDSAVLELLLPDPASCTGTPFFICGFLPNPDSLNDGSGNPNLPDNDGDAMHTSLSSPNPATRPEAPPPPGLLVTTFRFLALSPVTDSSVFLDPSVPGGLSQTRVLEVNAVDVTGSLDGGSAIVTVVSAGADSDNDGVVDECDVCPGGDDTLDDDLDSIPNGCDPCPSVATPGVIQGDTNSDLAVDDTDISGFIQALLGQTTDMTVLEASDVNCDGLVDGNDIQEFIQLLI